MIGLPRSGKSTYAKKFAAENNVTRVNADDLRLELYGERFYGGGEDMLWSVFRYMCKALVRSGNSIILVNTNITNDSRRPLLTLSKKYDIGIRYIYIDTPKDVCQLRALETKQENLVSVIEKMHKELELPRCSQKLITRIPG